MRAEQLHVVRALLEAAPAASRPTAQISTTPSASRRPRSARRRRARDSSSSRASIGRQQLSQRRQVDRRARALEEPAGPALQPLRHTHERQRYAKPGGKGCPVRTLRSRCPVPGPSDQVNGGCRSARRKATGRRSTRHGLTVVDDQRGQPRGRRGGRARSLRSGTKAVGGPSAVAASEAGTRRAERSGHPRVGREQTPGRPCTACVTGSPPPAREQQAAAHGQDGPPPRRGTVDHADVSRCGPRPASTPNARRSWQRMAPTGAQIYQDPRRTGHRSWAVVLWAGGEGSGDAGDVGGGLGEQQNAVEARTHYPGSPPRVRGADRRRHGVGGVHGITPACAGSRLAEPGFL